MNLKVNPYLSFKGQCEEAFNFYADCFGLPRPQYFRFAGSPMADQAPVDWQNKVMHATLRIGNSEIMGADALPKAFEPLSGFSMSVVVDRIEDADRVFNALSNGGKIQMPLQETFWAPRFGMVADPFGITWLVQCDQK